MQVIVKEGFRADDNTRRNLAGLLNKPVDLSAGRLEEYRIPLFVFRVFHECYYLRELAKQRAQRIGCGAAACPHSSKPQRNQAVACSLCDVLFHKSCVPAGARSAPFVCSACGERKDG